MGCWMRLLQKANKQRKAGAWCCPQLSAPSASRAVSVRVAAGPAGVQPLPKPKRGPGGLAGVPAAARGAAQGGADLPGGAGPAAPVRSAPRDHLPDVRLPLLLLQHAALQPAPGQGSVLILILLPVLAPVCPSSPWGRSRRDGPEVGSLQRGYGDTKHKSSTHLCFLRLSILSIPLGSLLTWVWVLWCPSPTRLQAHAELSPSRAPCPPCTHTAAPSSSPVPGGA